MDFNQVRYFVVLAETLNFTKAAEICCISQPALTQSIRRLEDELGNALIQRQGRYSGLTEFGIEVRDYFEEISRIKGRLQTTAKTYHTLRKNELNIGLMHEIGPGLVGSAIECFQIQNESISFVLHDVTEHDAIEQLQNGELDAAFCVLTNDVNNNFNKFELFDEQIVVVFEREHEFSKLDYVHLDDIAKQSYVDRLHCNHRHLFFDYCKTKKLQPNIAFRSHRDIWIQNIVKDGLGITIMPRFSITDAELHYKQIASADYTRKVNFIWRKENNHDQTMIEFVKSMCTLDWARLTGPNLYPASVVNG